MYALLWGGLDNLGPWIGCSDTCRPVNTRFVCRTLSNLSRVVRQGLVLVRDRALIRERDLAIRDRTIRTLPVRFVFFINRFVVCGTVDLTISIGDASEAEYVELICHEFIVR